MSNGKEHTVPPRRCLYLQNTIGPPPGFIDRLEVPVDVVRQHDLRPDDLASYAALVVPMHADQRHLQRLQWALDGYLDGGGTMLVNGHVAWPFLDALRPFVPVRVRNLEGLTIHRESLHPIFADVPVDALTFRRGVAGFYGRGSNPPPEGATVLHSVGPDRFPLDWMWERPRGGRLFVHAGNDLFDFLVRPEPIGAAPLRRLFDWLLETTDEAHRSA